MAELWLISLTGLAPENRNLPGFNHLPSPALGSVTDTLLHSTVISVLGT